MDEKLLEEDWENNHFFKMICLHEYLMAKVGHRPNKKLKTVLEKCWNFSQGMCKTIDNQLIIYTIVNPPLPNGHYSHSQHNEYDQKVFSSNGQPFSC